MTSFLIAATMALSGTTAVYAGMPQKNAKAITINTIDVMSNHSSQGYKNHKSKTRLNYSHKACQKD